MKSLSLMLLLLATALVEGSTYENVTDDETWYESITLKFFLKGEQGYRLKIVTMDAKDLRSILTSKVPLQSTNNNITNSFLTEFNHILIPFSRNVTDNNDVLMLAAEFNKKLSNFLPKLYIWVSFTPRNDITDDIKAVTAAVIEANLIYPLTVFAVILNYNLLQLDSESLLLVNHEAEKVSQHIKNVPNNEQLTFALMLDIQNCKNRMEYFKKLNLAPIDVLIFNVLKRDSIMLNAQNFLFVFIEQVTCLNHIFKTKTVPSMHSHLLIKISLENGSYNFNRNLFNAMENYTNIVPVVFWSKIHHQEKAGNTIDDRINEQSLAFIDWLQKPVDVSKAHLGAVVPAEQHLQKQTYENFHKVIIDITGHTEKTRKTLKQIVTTLVENSRSVQSKIQITLLVTITKNDFEINKKQVDDAVWAAVYGNRLTSGSVSGIVFDWMSCGFSESCSGYINKSLDIYCSYFRLRKDLINLYAYTKVSLDKITANYTLSMEEYFDVTYYSKLLNTVKEDSCEVKGYAVLLSTQAFKFTLLNEDVIQHGGEKMFRLATTQFSKYFEIFRIRKDSISHYYLKVVGCNTNYKGLAHLTEFALLYEKLNTWAIRNNLVLYVDAGIENPDECQIKVLHSPEVACKCGWWITTNITKMQDSNIIVSKKALALKLYSSKQNPKSTEKPVSLSKTNNKMLLWILVPLLLFAVVVTAISVGLTLRYRSKYIMTQEEVANFLKGRLQSRGNNEIMSEYDTSPAESLPYNSNKYELPTSSFTIDKSSCVGSGEFGKVFLGSINRNGTNHVSAVKVANTKALIKSHGGRMALFGLLSEIKILAYLGEHNHIVILLGAFTANLRQGEVAIFLEYCELGSLHSYLRSIQTYRMEDISDEDANSTPLSINVVSPDYVNMEHYLLDGGLGDELHGYCGDIASGMEFLASKNVVHADLATRNVLLTKEKVAKICDFGLSRRMYDYTEYVKQSQAPMPWRWMAPESFRRMIFNEKSDVWAFGITLWEIFTLSDEPYPGMSWNVNFPAMLARGLQLPPPRHNVKDIYSVMKRCWIVNPTERPAFTELKNKLNAV